MTHDETGWDMHSDPAALVPEDHRLPAGTLVQATVICHHPFGIGVRLTDGTQFGHVNVPEITDAAIRGIEDYPPIGLTTAAAVLGYRGTGQLRLSLRQSGTTTTRPPDGGSQP
jgi:predicted RNA-binding protein with RPS1 domain